MHSGHIIPEVTPASRTGTASVRAAPRRDTGITLKDGYYGQLRNGAVVGPLRALDPGSPYAYACHGLSWTVDGRYDPASGEPQPRDMILVWRKTSA